MVLPLLRLHDVRAERKALMASAICACSGDGEIDNINHIIWTKQQKHIN